MNTWKRDAAEEEYDYAVLIDQKHKMMLLARPTIPAASYIYIQIITVSGTISFKSSKILPLHNLTADQLGASPEHSMSNHWSFLFFSFMSGSSEGRQSSNLACCFIFTPNSSLSREKPSEAQRQLPCIRYRL